MERITFPLSFGHMTTQDAVEAILAQLPQGDQRASAHDRVAAILNGYDEQGLYVTHVLGQAAQAGKFEAAAGMLE